MKYLKVWESINEKKFTKIDLWKYREYLYAGGKQGEELSAYDLKSIKDIMLRTGNSDLASQLYPTNYPPYTLIISKTYNTPPARLLIINLRIHKIQDEWWLVNFDLLKRDGKNDQLIGEYHFICDELDGLEDCIDSLDIHDTAKTFKMFSS